MPRSNLLLCRAFAILTLVIALGACEERVVESRWGNLRSSAEEPTKSTQSKPGKVLGGGGGGAVEDDIPWAISVEVVMGEDHPQRAERRREELALATGVKDLWTVDKGVRSEIYSGHYKGADDKAAVADLHQWKKWCEQGLVNAPGVLLTPTHLVGSMPQYDLARADAKAVYTLEIGYFDRAYGKEFRKAAEQSVATLRSEGTEAYYHHGPDRSSITVGTFPERAVRRATTRDGKTQLDTLDPKIKALQAKHPTHFVNNQEQRIVVRRDGGSEALQPVPTQLVEIPR